MTTFKQLREEGLSKKEAMARLHERAAGDGPSWMRLWTRQLRRESAT